MPAQKCPDCSANMILVNNRNGTTSFHCEYCGKIIDNRPASNADKVFSLVNRAINAYNEYKENSSGDPYLDQRIADLRKRLEFASGKERAKLEKKLERELQYRAAVSRSRR